MKKLKLFIVSVAIMDGTFSSDLFVFQLPSLAETKMKSIIKIWESEGNAEIDYLTPKEARMHLKDREGHILIKLIEKTILY